MVYDESLAALSSKMTKHSHCTIKVFWLLSIPVALLFFALSGYLHIINFKVELHSIVMIAAIFIIYLFFVPHNAYFATCKFRKQFLKIKAKLLDYINKNLLEIAGYEKANASLDDFLQNTAKGLRNENFVSIAAGIFPTLGILGTFISIAISMPDFSTHTSEILEQEISKLLGGVGTAFYVSIYGIFLSIWWLFFEKTGVSRFQKDAQTIQDETKDFFWQKEEVEQTYFQKSMENFEKLNAVFDTFTSQEFLSSLNETLSQRMGVFERIIEHEQAATKEVATILQNSTKQLEGIADFQHNLMGSLTKLMQRFDEFAKGLQTKDESFLRAHKTLGEDFERAVNIAEILSQNTVQLNEALSNINAENVRNLYSNVLHNLNHLKQELDTVGEHFDKRLNQFDTQFLEKLRNTLELIDSETAQVVSHIAKLKE